jgi:hypothetical protein
MKALQRKILILVVSSVLYENAKAVTVYDTGYAFLMDSEGGFVYHPEMEGDMDTTEFDTQHAYLYDKKFSVSTK